ncbi:MAG: signal peptidase I [Proteobacteria bacterium]|nr:signal peptidase I [Pseudomonadota bacterium]MBU1715118.1 signal peptidase I [Pseudomonadota bacterium]
MTDKPRKPWLAVLLTFATLGLGQVYAGAAPKGIILFLVNFIFSLLSIPFWRPQYFKTTLLVSGLLGIIFFIYCLYDALKLSKAHKYSYELKRYNKWYVYLAIFIINSFVFSPIISATIKSYIVQAYKIPSGSMLPTILLGDHILADKYIYRYNQPKRGDIVIFSQPENPDQDLIKRVIGIAGDLIEIKEKQLYLNNHKYEERYAVHRDPRIIPGDIQPRDNFGPFTVPDNAVFVMGDNRDNSYDSRFFGAIDLPQIAGQAINLYWSWDNETNQVRWERVGTKIENETTD